MVVDVAVPRLQRATQGDALWWQLMSRDFGIGGPLVVGPPPPPTDESLPLRVQYREKVRSYHEACARLAVEQVVRETAAARKVTAAQVRRDWALAFLPAAWWAHLDPARVHTIGRVAAGATWAPIVALVAVPAFWRFCVWWAAYVLLPLLALAAPFIGLLVMTLVNNPRLMPRMVPARLLRRPVLWSVAGGFVALLHSLLFYRYSWLRFLAFACRQVVPFGRVIMGTWGTVMLYSRVRWVIGGERPRGQPVQVLLWPFLVWGAIELFLWWGLGWQIDDYDTRLLTAAASALRVPLWLSQIHSLVERSGSRSRDVLLPLAMRVLCVLCLVEAIVMLVCSSPSWWGSGLATIHGVLQTIHITFAVVIWLGVPVAIVVSFLAVGSASFAAFLRIAAPLAALLYAAIEAWAAGTVCIACARARLRVDVRELMSSCVRELLVV